MQKHTKKHTKTTKRSRNKTRKTHSKNTHSKKTQSKSKRSKTASKTPPPKDIFLQHYDLYIEKLFETINTISGKHAIDKTLANEFVNAQLSPARKRAAQDLIDNTVYITLNEVSSIVEQLVVNLYTKHDFNTKERIYLYCGKPNKSFYFIALLAMYYIKKHQFKEPTHFIHELNNEVFDKIDADPIIILDDVAYSGSQLSEMLNNIYYDRVVTLGKSPPDIYVLLIALNDFSKLKLENVPSKKDKYGITEYAPSPFMLVFLKERLYTPLILTLGIQRYFNMNLFFSPYTELLPYVSIYLDHKIADEASTYKTALLYGPIVPSNYNYKEYMEEYVEYLYFDTPDKLLKPAFADIIQAYNKKHGTKFDEFGTRLTQHLFDNLVNDDVLNDTGVTSIEFKPLIHTCIQDVNGLNTPEIVEFDYSLFIAPPDCFGASKNCILNNDGTTYYLKTQSKNVTDAKRIHAKINSILCPNTFYKTMFL